MVQPVKFVSYIRAPAPASLRTPPGETMPPYPKPRVTSRLGAGRSSPARDFAASSAEQGTPSVANAADGAATRAKTTDRDRHCIAESSYHVLDPSPAPIRWTPAASGGNATA